MAAAMEEEGDDFGDLYVDLDDQVYAGMSSSDAAPVVDGEDEKMSTPLPFDSPIATKEPPSNRPQDDSEGVVIEEEMEEEDDENGSDSEDDIRIVLNDEDCVRFGTGEAVRETGDGGECGEKARWICARKLPPAGEWSEQGERVLYGVTGGGSHHSQPKGFGRFSSPRSGQREWEGSLKSEVAESYSASTTAHQLGAPAAIRNGLDFFLHRSRTIFDINIEAFEWKPWKSPVADVTDYFNFEFTEDTWKSYCESVNTFRMQNMMSNPSGAVTAVKAFEFKQSCAAVSVKSPSDEVETISAYARPIGKAIQVEGGAGERMPSMETKRFRIRDSDAVIQIKMADTMENTSDLANFGLTSDNLDLKSKDNLVGSVAVDVENDTLLCEQAEGKSSDTIYDGDLHDLHLTRKISDSNIEKSMGQSRSGEDDHNEPSTKNAIPSPIGDVVGCDLNPSFLDSEESLNDVSSDENRSPDQSSSLDSVSQSQDSVISDKCVHDNSRCDNKRTNQFMAACSTSYNHDHIGREIKESSSIGNHIFSREDNAEAAHFSKRRGKKDVDHFKTTTDKRQNKYNTSSISGNQIKISVKHTNKSSSKDNNCLHRICPVEGDSGHRHRGKFNKSHSPHKRSSRYHHGLHSKSSSHEREQDRFNRRNVISAPHHKNKESSMKVPTYMEEDWQFYMEEDWQFFQRRKRLTGQDIRMEVERDYAIDYNHTEDMIYEWQDNDILYYEQDHRTQNKFHRDGRQDRMHPLLEDKFNFYSRNDSEVDFNHRRWSHRRSHEPLIRPPPTEQDRFGGIPESSFIHSLRKPRQRQRVRWNPSAFNDIASERSMENTEYSCFYSEQELRYDSPYRQEWLPDEITSTRSQEHDDFYFSDRSFRRAPQHEKKTDTHLRTSERYSDNWYKNPRSISIHEESSYNEARKLNNIFLGEELVDRPTGRQERKLRRVSKAGRGSCKRKAVKLTEEPYLGVAVGNKRKECGPQHPDVLIHQQDKPHDPVIHCDSHIRKSDVEFPVYQEHDGSELEEGQLVEEPEDKDIESVLNTNSSVCSVLPYSARNRMGRTQNNSEENSAVVKSMENNRLLEAFQKMQKRSERFKEPSGKKEQYQDPEKPQLQLQSDPMTVTDEIKQRPARKRRWGGS